MIKLSEKKATVNSYWNECYYCNYDRGYMYSNSNNNIKYTIALCSNAKFIESIREFLPDPKIFYKGERWI